MIPVWQPSVKANPFFVDDHIAKIASQHRCAHPLASSMTRLATF